MRFDSLILDSYGPFLNQELTFDPAPGRINLLVAPNGAGKSVLRGAFSDLLFGIGHQSPMTFAHPAARLRLTARVRLEDGASRVLVRRKGQGNTLSDGAQPIAPEDLRVLLGVRGRPTFQHVVVYPKAIPQYNVGYGRHRELMDDLENKAAGLFLAGHYRDGVSLGDSIVSGCNIVERVEKFLTAK